MRTVAILTWALAAGTNLWPAHAGATIEGTVALPTHALPPVAHRYRPKAGAVGRPESPTAVVFLEGSFGSDRTNAIQTLQLGQKEFQFQNGLLPVLRGTKVEFPNFDDDYHNVFSYSKPKRFDLGRYRKEEKPPAVTFDTPGVVKLYCEIHEHMRATVLVLDTPHFAKSDSEGRFRLENLPPGRFVLKAWLDEKTVLEQPVDLKDGETFRVEFPSSKK
jgi:plastocyanin